MPNKRILANIVERGKRYRKKMEIAEERLNDVSALIPDFNDKFKKLACYKAFQEVVDALFDIIAMILKDKGKLVEDDYANVSELEEMGIIAENEAAALREANGLRNRVIHKYNKTDDNTARESMSNLIPNLESILEKLRREK